MKRQPIPKIAVLVTGLAAAIMVATINSPAPAQAQPSKQSACTGCHTAGGSVAATPSSATPAAGASYTVALAYTGGTSPVGYWISGNGASVTGSSTSATMTAPAAAGTYTYTVWMRAGVAATTTYKITVGGTTPTTPPTTTPPTTTPPTTTPPTTTPPTTTPPTTTPPRPTPPRPTSTRTDGDDGDHDGGGDGDGGGGDGDGDGGLSPTSALGVSHLSMYNGFGSTCSECHDGAYQPKAPSISIEDANMKPGVACATCHGAGKKEADEPLFISLMNDPTKTVYSRCSDCHTFATSGHSDD